MLDYMGNRLIVVNVRNWRDENVRFDKLLDGFNYWFRANVINYSSSFSGSLCSATSFSSFDNLHVSGPGFSVRELCGVCVGVNKGVDGNFGGDDAGVLNIIVVVIFSKNASNCLSDNALCNVSSGLMVGTPLNPSRTTKFNLNQ